MPGGDTRAVGYHAPYPLTMARAKGKHLIDVDGNQYVDLLYNYTSLVHGHAYEPILSAADSAMRAGTAWPARNVHQVELAELLCERVKSVEQIRFCNSGSEATMLALQVARLATGRSKVLMARHGYHGSHEVFEAGFYHGTGLFSDRDTLVADFGDAASFEAVLSEHGSDIACVVIEAAMGSSGVVGAPGQFFRRVQAATKRAGAVFVLDEIITFRLATGGHQQTLGVLPDLTCFGKIIGGGFPVGALGGSAELMAHLDPRRGRLFHSGTFNGNPVTAAAGVVSVRELTADRIEAMHELAQRLDDGLVAAAAAAGLAFSMRRVGSLLNMYFLDEPPVANLHRADGKLIALAHLSGLNHGLFFAPRGMMALATCLDGDDISDVIERFQAIFADVAAV